MSAVAIRAGFGMKHQLQQPAAFVGVSDEGELLGAHLRVGQQRPASSLGTLQPEASRKPVEGLQGDPLPVGQPLQRAADARGWPGAICERPGSPGATNR